MRHVQRITDPWRMILVNITRHLIFDTLPIYENVENVGEFLKLKLWYLKSLLFTHKILWNFHYQLRIYVWWASIRHRHCTSAPNSFFTSYDKCLTSSDESNIGREMSNTFFFERLNDEWNHGDKGKKKQKGLNSKTKKRRNTHHESRLDRSSDPSGLNKNWKRTDASDAAIRGRIRNPYLTFLCTSHFPRDVRAKWSCILSITSWKIKLSLFLLNANVANFFVSVISIFSRARGLEQHFRVTRNVPSDRDDVSVWEIVGLLWVQCRNLKVCSKVSLRQMAESHSVRG